MNDGKSALQLLVPGSKKNDVLRYHHGIPFVGHLGIEKTLEKIKNKFYWPNMKLSVEEYCRKCDKCGARKTPPGKSRAPLRSYLVGAPMERIQIDVMGPLPQTPRGNKYILVVCDCFTKWTEAYALPNQESETITKKFVDEFVCRYGAPLQIHSDQGSNFEARTFQQMCDFLGIHKTRTTSMRPQSNGNV